MCRCRDRAARDFRRVVVDDAAYLMAADGGLARVRLDSGAVAWRTDRAVRPLSVVGDRLLAQADPPRNGVLALAVVDVRTGELRAALAVDLPDMLTAAIDDRPDQSFDIRATRAGADVLVRWEGSRQTVKGVPSETAPRTWRGALRVDVAGGRATPIDSDLPTAIRPAGVPDTAWRAGAVFAATGRDRGGCLALRRWDANTGAPRPDIPLECAAFAAVTVAIDGRHVLVGRQADASASAAPYVWTIHAAETGAPIGRVPGESAAEPFVVRDADLFYETGPSGRVADGVWSEVPPTLRAVDLRTSRIRWSVALRDTRHRGPFPRGRAGASLPTSTIHRHAETPPESRS